MRVSIIRTVDVSGVKHVTLGRTAFHEKKARNGNDE